MGRNGHVLVVDDHPLFREALISALQRSAWSGATIHQADSLRMAEKAAQDHALDLVLLDLNLADGSGFDGLSRLKPVLPQTIVVVVSATEQADAYARARALGAAGYLPKSLSLEELTEAMTSIADGKTWFPPQSDSAEDKGGDAATRLASLTPAQLRVIRGLSEGLLNKQIAYEMGISEATVKAHMTAILRKLGANNRTQALLAFKQATAISGDQPL